MAQAKAWFFEGLDHHNRHRFESAEACYRSALALMPDRVSVLVNLSAVLIAQSKFDEAATLCRRVLVLEPGNTECRAHLDACRHAGAPTRQRWIQLERAVAAQPDDAGAHDRLGSAWLGEGDAARALAWFDAALRLAPGDTSAGIHRAQALGALDRPADAVRAYLDCLEHTPGSLVIAQAALAILLDQGDALSGVLHDPRVERLLIEALETPLVMPQLLAPLAMARLAPALLRRDSAQDPSLAELAGNRLLLPLLTHARVTMPELEALLTRVRWRLLGRLLPDSGGVPSDAIAGLAAAVATQCWRNEYCWDASEAETAQVRAWTRRPQDDDTANPFALLAAAMYVPVETALEGCPQPTLPGLPDVVARLVADQTAILRRTRSLAVSAPRLTGIDDAASMRVPHSDDDPPSPRWTALPPQPARIALGPFARRCIAGAPALTLPDAPAGIQALDAGCGTGQHGIDMALRIEGLHLLAIDPSRGHLGYAMAMAQRHRVDGIRFGQADLLQARALGQHFHLIDATGALHRMEEPDAGLAALADCLLPHGLLRIALASRRGHAPIEVCRAWLQAQGVAPTYTGAREARRRILALPPGDPRRDVVRFSDFYATSACRELLLCPQEHHYALPEIHAMLARQGLQPLGLEVPDRVQQAFSRAMPGARLDDFTAWDRFEETSPRTFEPRFFVWAQKPG